jgi:hypothetical protein
MSEKTSNVFRLKFPPREDSNAAKASPERITELCDFVRGRPYEYDSDFLRRTQGTTLAMADGFHLMVNYRSAVVDLMAADGAEKLAAARERYEAADSALNDFWAR